ncbi:MAG: hypothetical protein L3J74_00535 [Bacteroidales bacterium]|nr:hypothetical protein [Bacteroidales bacterium]
MKKKSKFLIILFLSVFVLQINVNAQDFKKYYQKSGKLVQKLTGSATGEQTIIWDDYGVKELTISKINMMGMSMEQYTLYINNDLYTWGNQEPTVKHFSDDAVKELTKRKYTADDYANLGKEMMKQSNFIEKGKETVLGKNCIVWENPDGIKLWGWKNLTLKMEMNVMGMSLKYEPVSLDIDISIPSETFDLPKDKTVEENTDVKKLNENAKMIEIMDNMSKTGTNN